MTGIRVDLEHNLEEVSRALRFVFRDQLPFATSVALNRTAGRFVEEQREGMRKRFTIRRAWVLRGVRTRKRSTKQDLEATVGIEKSRDFLAIHEEGGVRRPEEGTRLAIPAGVRRTKTGVVPTSQWPRSFNFRFVNRLPGGGELYEGNRNTFMLRRPGGEGGVFQRTGRGGKGPPRLLFNFAPSVRVPPRLEFEETAERVFRDRFRGEFADAFDRAVRTAR